MKALAEMARQGNKVRGGKDKKTTKAGIKEYQRFKEICPLCDSVVLYLNKHLQRVHKEDRTSDRYLSLMLMARRYSGKSSELQWDRALIQKKKLTQHPGSPSTSRKRKSFDISSSDDDYEPPANQAKRPSPLVLLSKELLSSDSSDESYDDGEMVIVVPSPSKAGTSFMSKPLPKPQATNPSESDDKSDHGEAVAGSESEELEDEGQEKENESQDKADEGQDKEDEGHKSDDESDDDEYEDSGDDSGDYEEEEEEEEDVSSSDSEDRRNFPTWKEYYRQAKGRNLFEQLLIQYYQYLQDVLGGCKKERDAIFHAQNVRRIHDNIDKEDETLDCITDDGGLKVWKHWAKPLLDKKTSRPGTIRASLTSLVKFLEFIADYSEHSVKSIPTIDKPTLTKITKIIPRFIAMGSSVNQLYSHERWEQLLEDRVDAVNPSDTNDMVNSAPAKRALHLLLECQTREPSKKEFLVIRDFIIARISLENGQRPGPLETARVRDFERIENRDGKYVMYVSRHKRSKAGPAPLTMSANLKSNLEVYIKNVRPFFAREDVEGIFVTKEGNDFQPGTIGKCIIAWWRKATGKTNVSSTRLRKMHAAQLHKTDDVSKRSAHRLMCHSGRTAETYYMLQSLGDMAVKGHSVLAANIELTDINKSNQTPTKDSPKTPKFTEEESDDIDLLFAHYINTNASLSLQQTRNVMSESVNLISFTDDGEMVKKVYFRVKHLQRKKFPSNIEKIPEEKDTSRTQLWVEKSCSTGTAKSSTRIAWSEQDTTLIEEAFSAFDTCPKKADIKQKFESCPILKEVMTRNIFHRCYDKVKNIFKKRSVL